MKVAVILAYVVVMVVAEPPVPQDGHLASQYGAPSGGGYSPPRGRPQHSGPSPQYGAPSGYGGANENSEPANYEFKYDVEDQESGVKFGHMESRQGDLAQGEYYVLLPDGRTQRVQYEADQDGYRPKISYDEAQGGYGRGPSQGYPRGPTSPGYSN